MNFSGGGNTPSPRRELQGPRPAALKVNKDSHKIRKPPIVPPSSSSQQQQQQQQHPPPAAADERQPVIIYAVSPKVIHTTVSDFMNLVQRLTGNNNNNNNNNNTTGDLSPAARLASIENSSTCSPSSSSKDREREIAEMVDFLQDVEVGGRGAGGILSPAPASLPPISPGFFSPAADIGYNYNMFLPSSPSTLFSAPLVSPSPSSSNIQLFNPFFDF